MEKSSYSNSQSNEEAAFTPTDANDDHDDDQTNTRVSNTSVREIAGHDRMTPIYQHPTQLQSFLRTNSMGALQQQLPYTQMLSPLQNQLASLPHTTWGYPPQQLQLQPQIVLHTNSYPFGVSAATAVASSVAQQQQQQQLASLLVQQSGHQLLYPSQQQQLLLQQLQLNRLGESQQQGHPAAVTDSLARQPFQRAFQPTVHQHLLSHPQTIGTSPMMQVVTSLPSQITTPVQHRVVNHPVPLAASTTKISNNNMNNAFQNESSRAVMSSASNQKQQNLGYVVQPKWRRKYTHESFPEKLYRMLIETEENGKDNIVSFINEGTAFQIHKRDAFVDEILPHYFRHGKFSSFRRQLSMYGFVRIMKGPRAGTIEHEKFRKGEPELCRQIKRVTELELVPVGGRSEKSPS